MPVVANEGRNIELPVLQEYESCNEEIISGELSPVTDVNTYTVPSGSIIIHSKDGITRVFSQNGKEVVCANDEKAKKIATPGGFVPATYVHQVPSGSEVLRDGNVTMVYFNGEHILTEINENEDSVATAQDYDGYIETASDWSVNELRSFSAYWTVPSDPPSPESDTVNFLFPAIEPSDGSEIIQPVLEWNNGGTGCWKGSAWYSTNGQYYHSTPITVQSSHTLEGAMDWIESYGEWSTYLKDISTGAETSIYSSNFGSTDLAVFAAYEGYNIQDNSDVPGDTTFYNMDFLDTHNHAVDITWAPWVSSSASQYLTGLSVQIDSDSSVRLLTAN